MLPQGYQSFCYDGQANCLSLVATDRQPMCAVPTCADLSVLQRLDLQRGGNKRYQKTAAYGHFGRNHDPDFTWEQVVPLS